MWSYEEMSDIDPSIVEHEIKTYMNAKLVHHNPFHVNPRKAIAIKAEAKSILKDEFMYPVS